MADRSRLSFFSSTDRILALILGGGSGTRLRPLTEERAKPAVPLGGRYRLVDIPLSNCIHSNIHHMYVFTQFNSVSLHRHINNSYKFDTFSGGFVEVLAAEQTEASGDWYQGTADAIRQHLKHIGNYPAEQYLILSGDQLYRMDYRRMLNTHVETNADITVAVLPVTREAAKGFGVLKVESDGRIVEFVEKPQEDSQLANLVTPNSVLAQYGLDAEGRDYLASMGVYLFKKNVLESILTDKPEWVDFGKNVIPNSLDTHRVQSYVFDGFWEDIGTVRSYYETSIELASENRRFNFIEEGQPIYSRPRYLPGAQVRRATIRDSMICEGTQIGEAVISESIIGIRAVIQKGATIERSVLMGADFYEEESNVPDPIPLGIGNNTLIHAAIVDKNARIGDNVIIRGAHSGNQHIEDRDGDGWALRDGIVVVLKDATIPDGTVIDFQKDS